MSTSSRTYIVSAYNEATGKYEDMQKQYIEHESNIPKLQTIKYFKNEYP